MPARLLEITATFCGERHRFTGSPTDTIIGEVDVVRDGSGDTFPAAIKGPADLDDLSPNQSYRFYGHWTEYKNKNSGVKEKQFVFKTFVRVAPHTRAGVIGYLDKAPGIGRALAGRLYNKFGADAVRILREQPDVASAACDRLSIEAAGIASVWLADQRALEDCTIDLIELLDGRGFRKSVAKEVVKEWGNRAAQLIRQNPHRLMDFRGCGFKLCDALYLELGGDPAKLKRQALCGWYTLASNSSGDTWHYNGVVEQGIKGCVAGDDVDFHGATRLATRGGLLAGVWTDGCSGPPSWDGDTLWLADARKARNERRVAELVAKAMSEPHLPEFPRFFEPLTEHQITQLSACAVRGTIGILGGSPGTGKTFTAAQYIGDIIREFGAGSICVCAPTGKAAVRISEAMAAYNIPLVAKTIHSTLGVEQQDSRGGWSFKHNASNPLPFRFIFVDEASMIDTDLMSSLLAARARGTFILFIGDVNQLPPVGHGAPLRDLIAAGVPYGELTEIKRNDGGIVQACADMRDGKIFQCAGNLEHIPAGSPEVQIASAIEHIDNEVSRAGLNRVWDCQVLVAVNKKSKISRKEVNAALQKHLNANPIVTGSPFRLDDKVVNTKNRFYPAAEVDQQPGEEVVLNEKGDVYVANGELGAVTRVEPKFMEVRLPSPHRLIRVPRGAEEGDGDSDEATGTGCDWDLAYALSVHKSQGSEWPVVIVMVDEYPGARSICDRAWLYTAISRAKQSCVLIGKKSTADRFSRSNNIAKRKTFLRELILEELAKIEDERRRRRPLEALCHA